MTNRTDSFEDEFDPLTYAVVKEFEHDGRRLVPGSIPPPMTMAKAQEYAGSLQRLTFPAPTEKPVQVLEFLRGSDDAVLMRVLEHKPHIAVLAALEAEAIVSERHVIVLAVRLARLYASLAAEATAELAAEGRL